MGIVAIAPLDFLPRPEALMLRAPTVAIGMSVLLCPSLAAEEVNCPAVLTQATRLLVVTTDGMKSIKAHLQLYRRDDRDAPWQADGKAAPAVVGKNGLAWGFDQNAPAGEPVKREGDKKTPAGIFGAGTAFGNDAQGVTEYMPITSRTICVDDAASPLYNSITTPDHIEPGTSHEQMSTIPLYKQGLVITTGTSREARGGSCVFLHIWRGPTQPTVGCVAAEQRIVKRVQRFFDGEVGAIAILPASVWARYKVCGFPK